jgi:hypothetical protein
MQDMDVLTRISDLDLDCTTLERSSIECQSLLEAFKITEFRICKSLGTHLLPVFNDSDIDDVTIGKKFSDTLIGGIVREVAEMSSERRLVGKSLGEGLADRVTFQLRSIIHGPWLEQGDI